MHSPNFGTRMDIQQRKNLSCVPAGYHDYARVPVAYDFLQNKCHSRLGVCLVARGMKRRQRSVIIEQQHGYRRLRDRLQKRHELRFNLWTQRLLLSFPGIACSSFAR